MLLPNFVFTLIGYATLTQLSITFDNLKWQRALLHVTAKNFETLTWKNMAYACNL